MRFAPAVCVCLMIAAQFKSAVPTATAAPAAVVTQVPTDETILGLCGARLAMVFERLGVPEDLRASGDKDGGVDLDYGAFGLKIKNKIVTACFFWREWQGPVRGIKIGDSKEQVVKILGKHTNVFKYADGVEDYGWNLKKENSILWAYFDKDGRVKKITAELN